MVKVDEKSNVITAIPQLLETLTVAGGMVTSDAVGCQTQIAEKIIEREAEDVLALKENQGTLCADLALLLADLQGSQYQASECDDQKTANKGHARIEVRTCWTIADPEVMRHLRGYANWKHLVTGSRLRAQRWIGAEKTCAQRYHLASVSGAMRILSALRSHWGIENELPWTLALLRYIAHHLLKQEHPCKRGMKGKRLLAGWNQDYLLKVLAGFAQMGY
jgi:predicted transposase YbfD/YdcC